MAEAGGRSRVAIAVAVATVVATAVTIVAVAVTADSDWENAPFLLAGPTFGLVGAAILARQPGHRIGWIFAVIGITLPLGGLQDLAATLVEDGALGGGFSVVPVFGNLLWWMFLYFLAVLIPLWFPTGRARSRWWRWPEWLGGAFLVGAAFLDLFAERICLRTVTEGVGCAFEVANPIGIPGIEGSEESTIGGVLFLLLGIAIVGAVASLVTRFIRSRDVERLQLKWLTYSFSMLLLTILTEELVTDLGDVPEWVSTIQSLIFALVVLFIPISVGIAITRYQLYEIDRIVSRTVSYTIVIGGLALVFAAGAVWLPQQLPTANNNLAVAASTLIVAALFNPLRRRVQSIVDRRFHRLPYDPERVASDLSAHLREQVDSGRIIAALVDSSTTALRPASAGAWIRRGI